MNVNLPLKSRLQKYNKFQSQILDKPRRKCYVKYVELRTISEGCREIYVV